MATAIVVGENLELIETLQGDTSAGAFTYRVGQVRVGIGPLTLFKTKGTEDRIECSYKGAIDFGGKLGRIYVFQWDGKNLNQITLSPSQIASVTVDWAKDWELGKFAEEAVLKRPEDNMASAVKWIVAIGIFVACIVSIWSSYHGGTVIAKAEANTPAANISMQNQQILKVLVSNVIPAFQKQLNLTDNLLRNQSGYFQVHGG